MSGALSPRRAQCQLYPFNGDYLHKRTACDHEKMTTPTQATIKIAKNRNQALFFINICTPSANQSNEIEKQLRMLFIPNFMSFVNMVT
jgi:hypothetical protein